MNIVTANRLLHTPRYYWSVPVTVAFARRCAYTLFCPFLGLHDRRLQQATDLAKGLRIPNMGGSTDPPPKPQIQIPIASLPNHPTVPHPAVSCLEAS